MTKTLQEVFPQPEAPQEPPQFSGSSVPRISRPSVEPAYPRQDLPGKIPAEYVKPVGRVQDFIARERAGLSKTARRAMAIGAVLVAAAGGTVAYRIATTSNDRAKEGAALIDTTSNDANKIIDGTIKKSDVAIVRLPVGDSIRQATREVEASSSDFSEVSQEIGAEEGTTQIVSPNVALLKSDVSPQTLHELPAGGQVTNGELVALQTGLLPSQVQQHEAGN